VAAVVVTMAVGSGYLALVLLTLLVLVPLESTALGPLSINQIDAVYLAGLAGVIARFLGQGTPLRPKALGLATAAFLSVGLLMLVSGILAGADTQVALNHFRGVFGYAALALLVVAETDRRQRRRLAMLACLVAGLTAARGLLSWMELNGFAGFPGVLHRLATPDADASVGAVPSLTGRFGYTRAWAGNFEGNTLGAFLVLVLPVTASFALQAREAATKAAFAGLTAVMLVGLFVSYSRGAYFGLLVASVPLLLAVYRRSPATALALLAFGAAAVALLSQHLPGAEDRLATLRSLGGDPTVQHRGIVYRQIVETVTSHPVWGVGLGTKVGDIGTGADSFYLFLLLRGGVLAAAAFATLLWLAARSVVQAARAACLSGLETALGAGLLGFAAHSVVDFALWNPKVALTVWLFIGLLLAPAVQRRRDQTKARRPARGGPW
jgi:O-antigen ligase